MVNLTIRLNSKGGSTSAAGTPRASGGTPGIAAGAGPHSSTPRLVCGPHLTISDLPLASGVGMVPSVHSESTAISGLGVKVRRQPGNKVHFCVRCNFPIAIYGRLDPCEHVFCLVCSKKDINCYLCEEGILRIQKIELLEGIFVCGAAGCLRSFLSKPEFEWHVKDAHLDLLPSREAAAPATKPIDGLDQQQSLGGPREPSSSPSQQSRPASPPPYNNNTWRQENAARPSSPGPEKQGKPPHVLGPSRDHSEPQSTRRRADHQPGAAVREKDKERDSQKQGQRDKEHAQPDRDQSMREREPSQRERDRDRDRIRDRERDSDRDRERDFSTQSQRDRDRELWEQQQQHAQQQYPQQQQGNAHYPLPPPPPLPPLPFQSNAPGPPNQPGGTPGPYPPQQPFPPFHPQQQDSRNAARFESPRHAPFLDPRMGVPPDFQENSLRGRHPQQDGERARNMPPHPQQDGYGLVMERQGLMLPHFHGEFGAPPMGMMMGHQAMQGMNRFQDGGHGGGHLPPPHKRGNFGPGGEPGMGHPQHMFGWGGPANFGGGPGHPQFMNWQPPQ